jgi:hypothetical protein
MRRSFLLAELTSAATLTLHLRRSESPVTRLLASLDVLPRGGGFSRPDFLVVRRSYCDYGQQSLLCVSVLFFRECGIPLQASVARY